jgi:hypothetical protein
MSTSRSDRDPPSVGVASVFARALAAYREKSVVDPVEAGIELTSCGHCGGPRKREDLVCAYCERPL